MGGWGGWPFSSHLMKFGQQPTRIPPGLSDVGSKGGKTIHSYHLPNNQKMQFSCRRYWLYLSPIWYTLQISSPSLGDAQIHEFSNSQCHVNEAVKSSYLPVTALEWCNSTWVMQWFHRQAFCGKEVLLGGNNSSSVNPGLQYFHRYHGRNIVH